MSDAVTGRGRTTWFAGLDGLRALAVGAVILYHFQPTLLPGGFLGVDLFFVISGYLITRLLLAEIDELGDLSLSGFYLRRARRLLPAAVSLIAVVTLAGLYVWHDALPTLRGAVPASLGYVSNWWQIVDHQSYFVSTGRPPMLQHLWSLAIEEQFYLAWPVALIVLVGASLRHRRVAVLTARRLVLLAGAAVALALASSAAMAVLAIRSDVPYGADSGRVYFGTDTHAMGLLLGAAAAALAVRARFGIPRPVLRGAFLTDVLGLAALVTVAVTMLRVNEFAPGLYRGGFLAVSALCAVAVAAVPRHRSALGWLLDRAPLRWVGQRSYALYLWHWPVAVVTRPDLDIHAPDPVVFALRLALTVVLADLSYRLVERPIRTAGAAGLLKAWRIGRLSPAARSRLAPAVLTGLLVLVASAALGIAPSGVPASAGPASPVAAVPLPAGPTVSAAPAVGVPSVPAVPAVPAVSSVSGASSAPATPAAAPAGSRAPVAAVAAPPVAGISAFGDSVMLGAAPALRASLPRTTVYAIEGRQARAVFADIAARRASRTLAPVVVIHTGDNGVISPSDLRATLRSLADRRRVIVVNDRVPRDWQGPNNSLLAQVVTGFGNAVLVDWHRLSSGHGEWFYPDGLHLRPPGARAYAAFIAAQVR